MADGEATGFPGVTAPGALGVPGAPNGLGRCGRSGGILITLSSATHTFRAPLPKRADKQPMAHKSIFSRDPLRDRGFSLIELIIAVAIVAILAAVAIPIFLNQRNKADAAVLEQDLHKLLVETETIRAGLAPSARFPNGAVHGTGYPDYSNLKTIINNSGFKESRAQFEILVDFNCRFTGVNSASGDATAPYFGDGTSNGHYVIRGRTASSAASNPVTQYMYDSNTGAWEKETTFNNGGRWGALSGYCRYHTQW